jgi:hypothetical protein
MPQFPRFYLECIAYIYQSKASAKADKGFLGAGCITSVPSEKHSTWHFHYFVTNSHLVQGLDPVILRINTQTGCQAIAVPLSEFEISPRLDLAIAPISLPSPFKFTFIPESLFVAAEDVDRMAIGPGDELLMISRIIHKTQYKIRNLSAMRFGNIALMPQHEELFYLVEARSVAGHSGSPVLVYATQFALSGTRTGEQMFGPMLLGINRGHLRDYERIVSIAGKKPHPTYVSETNMAISQVVPAWYISQIMNRERFKQRRMKAEAKMERTGHFVED